MDILVIDDDILAQLLLDLEAYKDTIRVVYPICNKGTYYPSSQHGNHDTHKSTTIL